MPLVPDTLGERIRIALEGAGLSQTKAARLFGVDRNTLGLWIKGSDVPERQLAKIVEATGQTAAWLRYGVTEAGSVAVERYVTGYKDATERAIELLSRMEPEPEKVLGETPMDAQPPAERIGRAVEATRPAEGLVDRRKPKQA